MEYNEKSIEHQNNKSLNPYSTFWSFVGISLILFKYSDFFYQVADNKIFAFMIQFALITFIFLYLGPILSPLTKKVCEATKIPIYVFTLIYLALYVFFL